MVIRTFTSKHDSLESSLILISCTIRAGVTETKLKYLAAKPSKNNTKVAYEQINKTWDDLFFLLLDKSVT